MQNLYIFMDDSGTLHKNEKSGWFVYAGFIFTDRQSLNSARRLYKKANKDIKDATGRSDEIKAFGLSDKHKRSLYNSVRYCESFSVAVEISRLHDYVVNDKKSICRYKDYALKIALKRKVEKLIHARKISRTEPTTLHINVDEQLTATNGYYNLDSSILEEFKYGIYNWNYGTTHPNLFDGDLDVKLSYCVSDSNYMIQASDILANRIWNAYRKNEHQLLEIPNHYPLLLP